MLDKPQTKSMLDTPVAERMPREVAPGVFWIGDCLAQRHKGKVYHGYNAAYLVAGNDASILVDEIDLGGRTFMAVEPVIRDLRTTWWGFDTKERVLFPGDGFAYSHYHEDGHCGLIAEEAVSLDLPDVSSTIADLALFWTKFADMNVY